MRLTHMCVHQQADWCEYWHVPTPLHASVHAEVLAISSLEWSLLQEWTCQGWTAGFLRHTEHSDEPLLANSVYQSLLPMMS